MALTYSLKYKKVNFFQKVILEKEGEIIVDRQSFRLKGKGAQDMGENIYFSDIKELFIKDDHLSFTTFSKEKYILSNFANLFDSFIKDFMKVRNDFLAENLFMKMGMLIREFDGSAEIINGFGKSINKGKSRIQFYEGSIVVIPEMRDCFVIYLDFLKSHEFDEDDYVLKLFLDNGSTVNITKLGTYFEDCKETMESVMGNMYEKIINNLLEFLPGFDAATLLKLASKMRDGKGIQYSSLKKMHDDLPSKLWDLALQGNADYEDKLKLLRSLSGDENFYLGFSFQNKDRREVVAKTLFLFALPDKNTIVLGTMANPPAMDKHFYFFRIIMQQGDAREKLANKIMELNQCMLLFKFDLTPLYKDRKELNKSRYRTAIKRLSFLRLIRKSYLGRIANVDSSTFKNELEKVFKRALVLAPPVADSLKPKASRPHDATEGLPSPKANNHDLDTLQDSDLE